MICVQIGILKHTAVMVSTAFMIKNNILTKIHQTFINQISGRVTRANIFSRLYDYPRLVAILIRLMPINADLSYNFFKIIHDYI